MTVIANSAVMHTHTHKTLAPMTLSRTHSETTMRFFHLCRARTETAHVLSSNCFFPKRRVALGGVGDEVYRLWQPPLIGCFVFLRVISEILRNIKELRTNECLINFYLS